MISSQQRDKRLGDNQGTNKVHLELLTILANGLIDEWSRNGDPRIVH
jgi:hypothetical protein